MTYTAEQLRQTGLQNELLLDNAATCSQHPALEDRAVRECIVLNIINPLRAASAGESARLKAAWDASHNQAMKNGAACNEWRDRANRAEAELAKLRQHAEAMADELREPMALRDYRADFPEETK